MKIYTKTGDTGMTSLADGQRVSKCCERLEAYGTIDELNSHLGVLITYCAKDDDKEFTSPYSFAEITSEADYSVRKTTQVIKKLLELAEIEKTVSMLAVEIERNKRRVNALEFILIPQLEETIKYITGKLGENERAATTRLMKVKNMIANRD